MARRKGLKRWDVITTDGWLKLMGDTSVMSHLMMEIFERLYDSADHMDNGKNIASALHMEYRALNAGVGWAGGKIKDLMEKGLLPLQDSQSSIKKKKEVPSLLTLKEDGIADTEVIPEEKEEKRPPWEYVFDGAEGEDGTYFWILKPEAVEAFREIREARGPDNRKLRKILEEDESASGEEGNLFSRAPQNTVSRIRKVLDEADYFQRKSIGEDPCCFLCGAKRISLLKAYPYGDGERETKGLLFCPTHGTLFSAHLISFNERGELLISTKLSEEERKIFHLNEGEKAKGPFIRRRMAAHRKIFNQEARKSK